MKLLRKKIKSHVTCLEIFQSTERHQPKRTWRLVPELFGSIKIPRKRGSSSQMERQSQKLVFENIV